MKDLIQNAKAVEARLLDEIIRLTVAICYISEPTTTDHKELVEKRNQMVHDFKKEIAALCTALEAAQKQMESQKNEWLKWEAKRTSLEADAARYRWLRDAISAVECFHLFGIDTPSDLNFDAAINAAIAAQEKP